MLSVLGVVGVFAVVGCGSGSSTDGDPETDAGRVVSADSGQGPVEDAGIVVPSDAGRETPPDASRATCDVMPDADGDGARAVACGGDDCDDADARRYPGNAEVCDAANHDEDCDPTTFGYRDVDMDGYPDARCCNTDLEVGAMHCGSDCNDLLGAMHPSLAETCDHLDNDCDGETDEGVMRMFWPDTDGDGFGDSSATPVTQCDVPPGTSEYGNDCDDHNRSRNPGLAEVCDLVPDNDCDPSTHPFDADRDGHDLGSCGGDDCVDTEPAIHAHAPELCDGRDDDCSLTGTAAGGRDYAEDRDGDGHAPPGVCSGGPMPADDCDDTRSFVFAGATEHCNDIDDDCNAATPSAGGCGEIAGVTSSFAFATRAATTDSAYVSVSDMVVDASGNVILAGAFNWTVNFGGGDVACTMAAANADGFVASYTAVGALRWLRTIGGNGIDRASALVPLADGRLLVVGTFEETAIFGVQPLVSRGGTDVFLLPIAPTDGALGTAVSVGTDRSELVSRAGQSSFGAAWISGKTFGSEFAFSGGTVAVGGDDAGFLVQVDAAGHRVGPLRTTSSETLATLDEARGRYIVGDGSGLRAYDLDDRLVWTLPFTNDSAYDDSYMRDAVALGVAPGGDVMLALSARSTFRVGARRVDATGDTPKQVVLRVSPAGALRWLHVLSSSGGAQNFTFVGDRVLWPSNILSGGYGETLFGLPLAPDLYHHAVLSFESTGAFRGYSDWTEPRWSGSSTRGANHVVSSTGGSVLVAGACANATSPSPAGSPCKGFVARANP